MASSPTDLPVTYFEADDGRRLAYREMGEGFPVVLIHGLFSNAWTNWIRYGHAARVAAAGFRVIMPDLRAHGQSEAPHDPAAYPHDVLAHDGLALVRHLGLDRYHLGGYSLGSRTTVRMLAYGATPEKVVLAGPGLPGLTDVETRIASFKHVLTGIGTHPRGSGPWLAEAFLKTTGGDPEALLLLVNSLTSTSESDLDGITQPVLVLCGAEDHDNGSAPALAERLPNATFQEIPGTHMSAVLKPELGEAIARFFAGINADAAVS